MTQIQVLYETPITNGSSTIAPSASLTLLSDTTTLSQNSLYGSFNYLEIINDSACEINVDLDGISTRRRKLFGKSVLVIKAEEGIYFNNIKITNNDAATTIQANEISGSARIGKVIG